MESSNASRRLGLNRREYVHRRKGRYMAQTLEEFERLIEPLVDKETAERFKGTVRRKINALACDVCEMLDLEDENQERNGYAHEIRDKLDNR